MQTDDLAAQMVREMIEKPYPAVMEVIARRYMEKALTAQAEEIERLKKQVAGARQLALEEAANIAESFGSHEADFGDPPFEGAPGVWGKTFIDNRHGNEHAISAAIRALKAAQEVKA